MAAHKNETTAKDDHGSEKANVKPATTFSPSGAPNQTAGIDVDHPAVDNDPRKDTTADQNRIDFNDPDLSEEEAVEANLKKQQD
jgi:hypothetical protein